MSPQRGVSKPWTATLWLIGVPIPIIILILLFWH